MSGFLYNEEELTIICELTILPPCPAYDGLLSKRHRTHDITLLIDGERVYANKGVSILIRVVG